MAEKLIPNESVLSETQSLCPECLKRVPAWRVKKGDKIFLRKNCPEHGEFQILIWQGSPDYLEWNNSHSQLPPSNHATETNRGCPFDCGLCPQHRQQTCCVLLEVTAECNLQCPVCFASSAPNTENPPSLKAIEGWYRMLMESGGPYNIQLSGGEPTVRDDLPEIIAMGKRMGFDFFQINTNGLRLAADWQYTASLKDAGLNCVFLQFDGMDDDVYLKLRGRKLFDIKQQAIEVCAEYDIGVVLVPTLAPGVNDSQIGNILQFALNKLPAVRGVHFQPLSYFGRYPEIFKEKNRLTIPEILREIERQTDGRMKAEYFRPPGAEHAHCSFHGNFVLLADGSLKPLPKPIAPACCCQGKPSAGAKQARQVVARQWSVAKRKTAGRQKIAAGNLDSLDEFLERASLYKLAVSGMLFQDAWTVDLDRLKQCFIHVVSPDNRLIPFCAYNLTNSRGQALYRGTL